MKDVIVFCFIVFISICFASFFTGCAQTKATSSDLICKYKDINCKNVQGYEDLKACFVNQRLKEEFCERKEK